MYYNLLASVEAIYQCPCNSDATIELTGLVDRETDRLAVVFNNWRTTLASCDAYLLGPFRGLRYR